MLLLTCDSVQAGHLIDILTKLNSHGVPIYALSNWFVAAESQLLISNDAIDTAPLATFAHDRLFIRGKFVFGVGRTVVTSSADG
jgi:hypothetical protein